MCGCVLMCAYVCACACVCYRGAGRTGTQEQWGCRKDGDAGRTGTQEDKESVSELI